ncbi:T9SS type A sorting domain-containing protein [Lewinella cohaerens]|uniref:T9SS type A sorting domain-containing protein n=1 Tax=Lewinella cohaerens TaxID=70995 RepID=UPI00036B024E|nr:T9SS type A sorting domain-containing protein [Lewinella cohaerens]
MKHVLLGFFLTFFQTLAIAQSCSNPLISNVEVTNQGEITLTINTTTNFGQGVLGEVAYNINGVPPINSFSGLIRGSFLSANTWEVVIGSLPIDESVYIEVQAACCSDFDNCSTTGYDFTGFEMAQVVNLPVQFKQLGVNELKNTHNLTFTTATETNNAYFNIERSTDSRNWEKLGSIAGAGTTQQEQQYSFLDETPLPGLNYYRVKQVDYDGSFSYSAIVSARWEGKAQVHLFPNPTNDLLQISGLSTTDGPITIEIIDMAGRVMLRQNWNQSAINVSSLADGVYSLRIRSSAGVIDNQRLFIH